MIAALTLSAVLVPVALIAGISPLAFEIAFGVIVLISFVGVAWLTELEARDSLPGQKHDRERRQGLRPER